MQNAMTSHSSTSQRITVLSRIAWFMLVGLLSAGGNPSMASSAGDAGGANTESRALAHNKAGTCIAHICLETPITQKDIVAKYGSGRKHVSGGRGLETVTRCYYDPKQDLYVEFSFDKHQQEEVAYHSDLIEIMVSRVAICPKSYTPKRPFQKFETEYGLTIGSTEAEVQAAMGKPDRVQDMAEIERDRSAHHTHEELVRTYDAPDYGETSLFYNPDAQNRLLFNSFYISQGKVKSIHLNASE